MKLISSLANGKKLSHLPFHSFSCQHKIRQSENENLDEISQMDVMYRKDDISLYVL